MIIDRDVTEDRDGHLLLRQPRATRTHSTSRTSLYAQWQAAHNVLDDLTTRIERHLVVSGQLDLDETNLPDDPTGPA